jgi:hypothetical protein
MDEIYKKVIDKISSEFGAFFQNIPKILGDSSVFFKNIEDTDDAFVKASFFALAVSALLVFIAIPSYRINNVSLDSTFFILAIVITWILFVIYGVQLWVVSRLLLGKGSLLKSISAFFYANAITVFGKLAEIPSRVERDKELLKCGLTSSSTAENMTLAINSNKYAVASELYVFVFYILFFILIVNFIKVIHEVGTIRAVISGALGLGTISITVIWLQRPVAQVLLCAFKSPVS